jgi:hypothetical protein
MSMSETLPSPDLNAPPRTQWEREHAEFCRMLPQLQTTHPGQYVAVHDGRVVAAGDDELRVLSAAYQKCGYVTLHVGRVTTQPDKVARIPSPRFAQANAS